MAKTALTGLASTNIGGTTLHRFAGITNSAQDKDVLLSEILGPYNYLQRKHEMKLMEQSAYPIQLSSITSISSTVQKPHVYETWCSCQVLIIDESELGIQFQHIIQIVDKLVIVSMVDGKFFDKLVRCPSISYFPGKTT